MEISKYDPFSIDSINLNVKGARKYISVKTLLLSLLIVSFVFLLNWNFISNIYAGKSELQIHYNQLKNTQNVFTQTPVCFSVPKGTQIQMNATYHQKTINQTISQEQETIQLQKVANPLSQFSVFEYLADRQVQCYNLQGYYLRTKDSFQFQNMRPNSQLRVHIQTKNFTQIMYSEEAQIIEENLTISKNFYSFNFLKILYKDSLLVNYQEQSEYTFQGEPKNKDLNQWGTQGRQIFLIQSYSNIQMGANINFYTIVRYNIAQIIARVVAWKDIVLLLFAGLIGMYVQSEMILDICKNRYQSKYLETINSSIFTQFKRRISSLIKGIFKEEAITKYREQVQKDLDLVLILRKLILMHNVIQEADVIGQQNQEQFQYYQSSQANDILNQLDTEQQECSLTKLQDFDSENQNIYDQQIEQKQGISTNIEKIALTVLTIFDFGSCSYSIVPNKGRGHGSICNMVFLLICCSGFIALFLFLGIFKIQQQQLYSTIYPQSKQQSMINIGKDRLVINIFSSLPAMFAQYFPHCYLMKDRDQVIEQLQLRSGDQCWDIIRNQNGYNSLTKYQDGEWHCLKQNQTIYSFGDQNRWIKVNFSVQGMFNIFSALNHHVFNVQDFFNGTQLVSYVQGNNFQSQNSKIYQFHQQTYLNQYNQFDYQDTLQVYSRKQIKLSWTARQYQFWAERTITRTKLSSQSIWDIMDNTWGIVILILEVMIIRVCYFINNKLKKSHLNLQQQSIRTNVLFILGTLDRLVHGSFKKQFEQIPSYFKKQLPDDHYHMD